MSHSFIKPDTYQLQALLELPPPLSSKCLQRTIGLFAYYGKRIQKFSDKIKPLSDCKVFPIEREALRAFENLKEELGEVALQNIDEDKSFIVKCDASEVSISVTLNQISRPVAFMSRKFEMRELYYSSVKK